MAANGHGISFTGADTIQDTGVDALTSTLESGSTQTVLRSVDPGIGCYAESTDRRQQRKRRHRLPSVAN
jgi:hypothetical protein